MTMPVHTRVQRELEALRDASPDDATRAYIEAALERLRTPTRPGTDGPTAVPELAPAAVARLIDHTQLAPDATDADIDRLCTEARTYEFASVCVHPLYVAQAADALGDAPVATCTVIGFPHGAHQPATKAYEARQALEDGAQELDMVMAIGRVKSGHYAAAAADIRAVVTAAHDAAPESTPPIVKVILETALLTDAEKAIACVLAKRAGADFVKTSTGFAASGATVEDVALMRQVVGQALGVKASGGVRSLNDVRQMVAHGATRIGASGGVAIMDGIQSTTKY